MLFIILPTVFMLWSCLLLSTYLVKILLSLQLFDHRKLYSKKKMNKFIYLSETYQLQIKYGILISRVALETVVLDSDSQSTLRSLLKLLMHSQIVS